MLQSFLSRLGRWSELPSSFEFTVCEEVALPFALPCGFLLFNCRRKSDDMPASVFVLHKKQPSSSSSCTCSSTGGCCSSCASGGATSGAHRPPTAIAAALAAGTDLVQQGRQHLKRVKTLLHPDLLKVLQTHESDAAIYVVTERCWPLPLLPEWTAEDPDTVICKSTSDRRECQPESTRKTHAASFTEGSGGAGGETDQREKATRETRSAAAAAELEATVAAAAKADVAWGLLQIANAVAFLQDSCQLVHGEVNPLSVFVTADGICTAEQQQLTASHRFPQRVLVLRSWKLSALELVRPFQPNESLGTSATCSASSRQEQDLQQLLADQRRTAAYLQGWHPPEPLHSLPLQWTDWWGLASVLVWSYTTLLGRGTCVGQGGGVQQSFSRSTDNAYSYSSKSYSSSYSSYSLGSSRGYGRQLFELSSATVRDTAPSVPPAARQFLKHLLSPVFQPLQGHQQQPYRNGRQLMRLSDLVKQTSFFSVNCTCNCMQFLREVHVKGAYEKEMFFEKVLPRQLQQPLQEDRQAEQQQAQAQTLPLAVQQQQVLPELLKLLDPTTCTTSGNTSCGPVLECASSSLTPAIVSCVALIAATMKPNDLLSADRRNLKTAAAHLQVQRLRVVLEKLFKSSDRALRYTLLTSLDDFEPLLTRDLCERTFSSMILGLVDSTPVIREATVKALVVFCQKIATPKVLQTCLEQLRRLTEDPEAVLRTNACICAAKICSLQETVSLVSRSEKLQQLLAQVLLAAMRDIFPLCRVASLQHALSALPLQTAMLTLSPAVAAATVDLELSVAEAAVQTLQILVSAAATATAERRAAACRAEAASAAGGAANADGSVLVSQQQAGGNNSSMLTKAAASLPNPVAVNFGNGGWFGVAGVLSSGTCSELLSAAATGHADSYTVTSSYGTSTTSSTHDTVSSSSSTRSMACSVNVPPPPPPGAGHRRESTAPAETPDNAPRPGRSSSYTVAPAAEKRRENFLDTWEVTEAPVDSAWDVSCADAWQDVGEPAGAGLRKDSAVSGGASYSSHIPVRRQQDEMTLLREKGSITTASLDSAATAISALSASAAALGIPPASPAAALGGCRDINLSAKQRLRKSGSREPGLFSSTSSLAAGKHAATAYAVGASGVSTAAKSGTKIEAAAVGDDFFAEMERQLREPSF